MVRNRSTLERKTLLTLEAHGVLKRRFKRTYKFIDKIRESSKMKKIMAYSLTAVLLGFTVMMLPLAFKTGLPTPLAPTFGEKVDEESRWLGLSGLTSQPLNLLPSILIFISGLIVALGVYAIIRKRMV